MTEYRVVWIECPTATGKPRVVFVEANNPKDAEAIAVNHIERKFGLARFVIRSVAIAGAVPAGRVVESR